MKIRAAIITLAVAVLYFAALSFAQIDRPILSSAQVPFYPDMARTARVQGAVILTVTVSPAGDVSSVQVISGNPLLRKAAEENVKSWKVRWPRNHD